MASCDEVNHPSKKYLHLQIAASDFQDLKKYVVQDQLISYAAHLWCNAE